MGEQDFRQADIEEAADKPELMGDILPIGSSSPEALQNHLLCILHRALAAHRRAVSAPMA
jgi:hypothetical protein